MAKQCDICQRSATKGASRSHSNIKTLRRQGINLQSCKIDCGTIKVCTSCLKTAKKMEKAEEKQ